MGFNGENMKYRIIEIFCVVCAALFIVFSVMSNTGSKKSADEIYKEMSENSPTAQGVVLRDNTFFKKTFGISADGFEGFVYYSSDDVMNVNELLIVKFDNKQSARELTEKIEKYISDNRKIFEGYAPQQEEMLKNYVLETNTNTLFFYVGEKSEAVKDAFNNAL